MPRASTKQKEAVAAPVQAVDEQQQQQQDEEESSGPTPIAKLEVWMRVIAHF